MPAIMARATRWRTKRVPPRWAQCAAQALRLEPATVEWMIHGDRPIQVRLGVVFRELQRLGELELLAKIERQFQDARAGDPIPSLSHALIAWSQEADVEEELRETIYLLEPTLENLRHWRVAQETAYARAGVLLRATLAEEQAA